jgi:hypothetical protein
MSRESDGYSIAFTDPAFYEGSGARRILIEVNELRRMKVLVGDPVIIFAGPKEKRSSLYAVGVAWPATELSSKGG